MSTLEESRIAKLEKLRELGVDPFGRRYTGASAIGDIVESYNADEEGKPVKAAGRITQIRGHGKAAFFDIADWTGKMQVYVRKDRVGDETFDLFKLLDLGDIVGVEGGLFKTRTGEISIFADIVTPLTKSLLPPPEKWHGLRDVEIRYRQRYVDLVANREVLETFLSRTQIIREFRRVLDERGFVEVETPMMQPIPGGAAARPFITHHNTLDIDLYLRIAPELYLKRLLVGGMERVYEINRNFRNEGISTRHNPEFTMLEAYQAYANYEDMMELTEAIIAASADRARGGRQFAYGESELDLTPPWPRRKYADLLLEHAGVAIDDQKGIIDKARALQIETEGAPFDVVANEVFEETVEKRLWQPTFVLDYPKALCPLTKACDDNSDFAQRFELYIAGMEIANAYSELNDPLEQEQRFREQLELAEGEVREIDHDFLRAQKHGMPPAGGLGIGIDRVVMLLTNSASIRDVILFPLLRPEAQT